MSIAAITWLSLTISYDFRTYDASNILLTWKNGFYLTGLRPSEKCSPLLTGFQNFTHIAKIYVTWPLRVNKFFHVLVTKIFSRFVSCSLPVNLFRHPRQPAGVLLQPHNKWQKCFWQMEPTWINRLSVKPQT